MSLPVPPAGVNPYPFYRSLFRPSYFPSPGFQARIIILGVFTAALPILATLLFALHVAKMRRQNERVFLFKRVRRPAGSYIVGARTPLLCVGVLSLSIPIGLALRAGWRYVVGTTLDAFAFNAYMNSYWILTFVGGWTYSCCNFQTYLLVDGDRRFHLSPFFSNAILLGGLVTGGAATLGLALYARTLNVRFYHATTALFALLEDLGRSYDGTFDPAVLSELGPLAGAYGSAASNYFDKFPALLVVFAACPLPVIILNVSAIFIWLILRRQAKETLEMGGLSTSGGDTDSSGVSGASNPTAQRRKEMKAIEHSFLVDAVGVFLWSSSVFVTSMWTATIFKQSQNINWSRLEACLFLPAWSASVPLAMAMAVQVVLAWQGLPPPRRSSAEASDGPTLSLPRLREDMVGSRVQQVALVRHEKVEKTASKDQRVEELEGQDESLEK